MANQGGSVQEVLASALVRNAASPAGRRLTRVFILAGEGDALRRMAAVKHLALRSGT